MTIGHLRLGISVGYALVAVFSFYAPAQASSTRCGMIIEEQAVLDRDLRCDGPAFVLRNPRTILQLNGHTVESALPCADAPAGVGVQIEPSAERAQVLGPGLIRGFARGIVIDGAPRTLVRDLRVSDSCASGIAVHDADGVRARNLIIDRNAAGSEPASAVLVDGAEDFALAASSVFANAGGRESAAVELRGCASCRVFGNRIVANGSVGVLLDVESNGNEIERNVILGQRHQDVVDKGADNVFALNTFETASGLPRPSLWPLVGESVPAAPGVAGCGTLHVSIKPRETATLTCPQDPGLRGLRNSVVAYRFLNPLNTRLLLGTTCDPAEMLPASASSGGTLRCTNNNPIWSVVLEMTCCLN